VTYRPNFAITLGNRSNAIHFQFIVYLKKKRTFDSSFILESKVMAWYTDVYLQF